MKINEIFYSIQGEGPDLGMPAIFVRVSGCNFNCDFCDTEYESGIEMTIEQIVEKVTKDKVWSHCRNVIVTGGEPLIQVETEQLINKLVAEGLKVFVETNGSVYNENIIGICKIIVSPKLESVEDIKTYYETIMNWNGNATFKFVIGEYEEFQKTKEFIQTMNLRNVYLMPKCLKDNSMKTLMIDLVEWVKKEIPTVKVTPRLHIYLYGLRKGT